MMTLSLNPTRLAPPPSFTLNQLAEKPAVTPNFSGVDSFEKAEASTAKARSGGTFNVNRKALEGYLERFYLEKGEAIPNGMIKELLTSVTKKVFKEAKEMLPSIMQEGIEPTVTVKLKKSTVVLDVAAVYDPGIRPFLVNMSNLLREVSGNPENVPNVTPQLELIEKSATTVLDIGVERELAEKMRIPCEKVEPKA